MLNTIRSAKPLALLVGPRSPLALWTPVPARLRVVRENAATEARVVKGYLRGTVFSCPGEIAALSCFLGKRVPFPSVLLTNSLAPRIAPFHDGPFGFRYFGIFRFLGVRGVSFVVLEIRWISAEFLGGSSRLLFVTKRGFIICGIWNLLGRKRRVFVSWRSQSARGGETTFSNAQLGFSLNPCCRK